MTQIATKFKLPTLTLILSLRERRSFPLSPSRGGEIPSVDSLNVYFKHTIATLTDI